MMACRIPQAVFERMAQEEADKLGLKNLGYYGSRKEDTHPGGFELVHVAMPDNEFPWKVAMLHRKPIQSLVDEAEQARPIIRNLLRWAKEHGAK